MPPAESPVPGPDRSGPRGGPVRLPRPGPPPRPPLTSTDATFTLRAVGADEGAHGDNNSRSISLTW